MNAILVAGAGDVHESDRGSGPRRGHSTISAKWCGRHCALWTRKRDVQFVFGPTDTLGPCGADAGLRVQNGD